MKTGQSPVSLAFGGAGNTCNKDCVVMRPGLGRGWSSERASERASSYPLRTIPIGVPRGRKINIKTSICIPGMSGFVSPKHLYQRKRRKIISYRTVGVFLFPSPSILPSYPSEIPKMYCQCWQRSVCRSPCLYSSAVDSTLQRHRRRAC